MKAESWDTKNSMQKKLKIINRTLYFKTNATVSEGLSE